MKLNGSTRFRVPPERLELALHDPRMLRQMVPGCVDMVRLNDTDYEGRIEKTLGALAVRMKLRLQVEPQGDGRYLLRASGRNALLGAVSAALTLVLEPAAAGTVLRHSGDLTASGLAGRLLKAREDALAARTEGMFRHLRDAIEA